MNAVIVDDETLGREVLKSILEKECPEVNIVGLASSAFEAKVKVQDLKPDILFLDINMPKINGFDLLNSFKEKSFQVIIVTAHREYGMKALEAGAMDYLLKPIIIDELKSAIEKVKKHLDEKKKIDEQPVKAKEDKSDERNKIMLTHSRGFKLVPFSDILYVEAQINYSTVYLTDGTRMTLSKTLKTLNSQLPEELFYRIHKSYLINLSYIKEYINNTIVLNNGVSLPVSRNKLGFFVKHIKDSFK